MLSFDFFIKVFLQKFCCSVPPTKFSHFLATLLTFDGYFFAAPNFFPISSLNVPNIMINHSFMSVYQLACHLDLNYVETHSIFFSALILTASLVNRLNFDILFFNSSLKPILHTFATICYIYIYIYIYIVLSYILYIY